MEARDGLVGGAIAAGVAKSAVTRAQAGRCRCDWRSGAQDRSDEGVIGLSPAAPASGGLAMRRGSVGGHAASALTPGSDGGGSRGPPPRSKVSTMIMRPPQRGHGGRWSFGAAAAPVVSSRTVCGSGAASSSLARAMFALRAALARSP